MTPKKGVCKYYKGLIFSNGICTNGINVRELVGGNFFGWLSRTPCKKAHGSEVSPCDKYVEPSGKDIAEHKILMKKEEVQWAKQRKI